MIAELDRVALTRDFSEHGLLAGDIGCVMAVHADGKGFTVEFVSFGGKTVALITLDAADIRSLRPREIAHVRELA